MTSLVVTQTELDILSDLILTALVARHNYGFTVGAYCAGGLDGRSEAAQESHTHTIAMWTAFHALGDTGEPEDVWIPAGELV